MHEISYYREQAERAKRLSYRTTDRVSEALASAARDFADIADDLERGAAEVRHPELATQSQQDAAGSNNHGEGD